MWCVHTVEHYSTVKWSKLPTHTTMWMLLKNIMLSERSQAQKTSCLILCKYAFQERPIRGDTKQIGGCLSLTVKA